MRFIVVAVSIVLLSFVAWLWIRDRRLDRLADSVHELTRAVRSLVEERAMVESGELYAAWYSGNPPELIEVRTVQRAGETDAQTIARHDADVAAKREQFPPILGD